MKKTKCSQNIFVFIKFKKSYLQLVPKFVNRNVKFATQ